MSLPFLVLGVLEVVLRIAGLGPDVRLVRRVADSPSGMTHELNPIADFVYYGGTNLQGPEWRQFRLPKPPGVYRILVFGASTVIGFPYAPEVAFPRHVEVQLKQQNPQTAFEVLNCGITSINSFSIVDLLRQAVACRPDLIVLHEGHNEFYGPGGPASTAGRIPRMLIQPMYHLRRLRLWQSVELLNPFRSELKDDLLDSLPVSMEIPLEGPVMSQASDNFRENLRRCCRIAADHGIPVLLTSVACNLKDQSPMRSLWPAGSTPQQRTEWERLLEGAEAQMALAAGEQALEILIRLEQTLSGHARLTFRKAQCLEALGRHQEALLCYRQARDEDACRFRAPSRFAEIAEQVAGEFPGASFLDVEEYVNSHSTPAGPGGELFLEHVHYSFDGHVLLGELLARTIQTQVRGKPWLADRVPSREELEDLLGVVPEDHLAAFSSAIEVMQTGPLKSAVDAPRHETSLKNRIQEAYYSLEPDRRETFADIPMNLMVQDLIGALVVFHEMQGHEDLSRQFAQRAKIRRPWTVSLEEQPSIPAAVPP